ncbi:MAG: helix-turn-helix domain-containing protein [Clostridia bacterium]|nr:helix-turn-helix domain-containing protein [Clostridia bacterium]
MKFEYNLQEPAFTVENINIQNVARPCGYKHSNRNGRMKHGFIYVVKGRLRHDFLESEVGSIEASAGDLVFIPQSCAYYTTYLEEQTEIKEIQFDLSSGTLPSYLSAPCRIELPNAREAVEALFLPSEGTGHPFYYLASLYRLLWQIDDHYARLPAKYKKLQPALAELSQCYDKNAPVSYYAALCDMSEVHFRRLFREFVGASPVDYRNDLRLTNARVRLQSGEYNVSEAAESVGFSNLSFFIRLYKKKYGNTPKKE